MRLMSTAVNIVTPGLSSVNSQHLSTSTSSDVITGLGIVLFILSVAMVTVFMCHSAREAIDCRQQLKLMLCGPRNQLSIVMPTSVQLEPGHVKRRVSGRLRRGSSGSKSRTLAPVDLWTHSTQFTGLHTNSSDIYVTVNKLQWPAANIDQTHIPHLNQSYC